MGSHRRYRRRSRGFSSRRAAKQRAVRRQQAGTLGCVFGVLEVILLLMFGFLLSDHPGDKKIGLGILGVIVLFCFCASAGVSGEGFLIILAVAIVVIIVASCADSKKTGSISVTNKEIKQTTVKKHEEKSFEEQYEVMRNQVMAVKAAMKKGESPAVPVDKPTVAMIQPEIRKDVDSQKDPILTKTEPVVNKAKLSVEVLPDIPAKTKPERLDLPTVLPTIVKKKYYDSISEAIEKFEIPNDYRRIMIEQLKQTEIKECPGLIWKDESKIYVLPLLMAEKIFSWPIASASAIIYEKRSPVDPDKEYVDASKEYIFDEFEDLLPEYPFGSEGVYSGSFSLPVGLAVTNTSGKTLFEILDAPFYVVDDITQSTWYAKEIKELYQKHILLENGILTISEYENQKSILLNEFFKREKNFQRYHQQIDNAKDLGIL